MTDSTVWRANCQSSTIKLIPGAISKLGSFVHNLIKGRENIISELHLRDSSGSRRRCTDSKSSDTLLRQRRVEDAIRSILFIEAHCTAKNSTELHIFAKDHRTVIFLERNVQCVSDSRPQVHVLFLVRILQLQLLNVEGIAEIV